MLRPERMSRVSVTGSRRVMDDVVEAVHDLNLLHLVDYDGSWEGFDNGDPMAGAESASDRLVTVRSIESILEVSPEDAGPTRIVTDDAIESELEDIRTRVNALDDRRSDVEDELRDVEDRLEAIEPFEALGIDLDLYSGYDAIEVAVGEADEDEVAAALRSDPDVEAFETFAAGGAVAAFARSAGASAVRPPRADGEGASRADGEGASRADGEGASRADGEGASRADGEVATGDVLADALVGVDFAELSIPDAAGSPDEHVAELEHRRQQLRSKLSTVEDEIEDLKLEAADFLLAAEEKLTIDVQKREVPLQFATTKRSFVAEGWVPSDRYDDLEAAVADAVGDHADVEELERAAYDERGLVHEEAAAADGGTAMADDGPPVVLENPGPVKPFELLVEMVERPRYTEFDPTVLVFLTFPLMFGFMIGDVGYGLLYLAIGYVLWTRFDDAAVRSLGGVGMWAGGFTVLFGILYGEVFGLHLVTDLLWEGTLGLGGPPIEKGLSPAASEFARLWLVVSVFVGLAHVTTGYVLGFLKEAGHDVQAAVLESGSWAMLMVGIWVWILSRSVRGAKPEFVFEVLAGHPIPLGFEGFPAAVGLAGLGVGAVGFALMLAGEVRHWGGVGVIAASLESLQALVNVLSYARLAAVLLAKSGMAFVVNLLFFGVYTTGQGADQHFHFALGESIHHAEQHAGFSGWLFEGLVHPEFAGVGGVVLGLFVLVVGHVLVLALGITSAGLQAVRLEYVEFFNKFYDGGGAKYQPFGYERTYTTED